MRSTQPPHRPSPLGSASYEPLSGSTPLRHSTLGNGAGGPPLASASGPGPATRIGHRSSISTASPVALRPHHSSSSRPMSGSIRPGSTSSSFIPRPSLPTGTGNGTAGHPQEPGDGIPGFQTSFHASGRGGGSFRAISENFSVNPASGTLSLSIPISTSQTRGDFGPDLSLAYDSGSGNGLFGFGWGVGTPSVQRKTACGIPKYLDDEDEIVLQGQDILPQLDDSGSLTPVQFRTVPSGEFTMTSFRLRLNPQSIRIERWTSVTDESDVHWRTISSENVTSVYGEDDSSRIMDYDHHSGRKRVFSWLLSRTWDAHGNAIEYTYKQEDGKGLADEDGVLPIWEKDRPHDSRCRQKYLKSIKYGNRSPNRDLNTWEATLWPREWMFEVVFDYGEHDPNLPGSAESYVWPARKDAFSRNNSGFEVRTYRLCRRVLIFHRFPEHTSVAENLVSSVAFTYDETLQSSMLTSLVSSGHAIRARSAEHGTVVDYETESLPAWSFSYTVPPDPSQLETLTVNISNLTDVPGLGSVSSSEWIDIDGEGIPGLLTRLHDGTLTYQRNMGSSSSRLCSLEASDNDDDITSTSSVPLDSPFRSPRVLSQQPTLGRAAGRGHFQDLDHNGRLDLVCLDNIGRLQGFYEREGESDSWSEFSDFPETPITTSGENAAGTSIDLTGNGLPDLLLQLTSDSQDLVWEENMGKKGFSAQQRRTFTVSGGFNEKTPAPSLIQTAEVRTHVADMTGDGLSDLVEVSTARIRYWPNQGHGVFGAAVEMGNPPVLGGCESGLFDHERVRLIDVDGSGTTDLLYILPGGGVSLYYNLAGNSWSNELAISALPHIAAPSSVFVLDILGQGTASLCWTDPLLASGCPGTINEIMHLDLMGSTKPHLLREYSNGLGATTSVSYAPSTRFYLNDEAQDHKWTTRLPFPVQCVAETLMRDELTGCSTTIEYAYHNGCYDPVEEQFAGFEMVEKWQREKLILGASGGGETYKTPTTHTREWYGVGLGLGVDERRCLTPSLVSSRLHARSYVGHDAGEQNTGARMGVREEQDAVRALRGAKLRSEVYSRDGTEKADRPYLIQEFSYDICQLQPKGPNRHAVVQMTPRAAVTSQYERKLDDPRVTHEIVLKTNVFADIEQALTVVYPRSVQFAASTNFKDVKENQTAGNVSLTRCWFTEAVEPVTDQLSFRRPLPWRQQDYEILGFPLSKMLDVDDTRAFDFEVLSSSQGLSTRKVPRSEERCSFLSSDLSRRLGDGKLQAFSVVDQGFTLAFTPDILSRVKTGQEKCGVSSRSLDELMEEGGYVKLADDGHWWASSPRAHFCDARKPSGAGDTKLQEARRSFYVPRVIEDVFGNRTTIKLDKYFLMAEEVEDAVGNVTAFENSYEHLQAVKITDANRNISEAMVNPLGQVVAIAVAGKGDEQDGDSLEGFEREVRGVDIDQILADPSGDSCERLLGKAGTRTIFCLDRYTRWKTGQLQLQADPKTGATLTNPTYPQPAFALEISRDLSFRKPTPATLHLTITYFNGHGQPLQQVLLNDPLDPAKTWLVAGSAVASAAGHVVREYESFFAPTPMFVPVKYNDSSIAATNFYDALGRNIAALAPNHTWSKTTFTPWTTVEFDAGNTVLCSKPQDDPDVGIHFSRIASSRYLPTWNEKYQKGTAQQRRAADKSAVCSDSPTVTHIGRCGIPIRQVRQVGSGKIYTRAATYDYSGNRIHDFDSLERLAEKNLYDKLNRPISSSGMDNGEAWEIHDVHGSPLISWNSRGICFEYCYDQLRREVKRLMRRRSEKVSKLIVQTVYGEQYVEEHSQGETSSDPAIYNLRGEIWKIKDQSGVYTNARFDIRGRQVEQSFKPAREYKQVLDWTVENELESPEFHQTMTLDDFGQVIEEIDAQGNCTRRKFSRLGHVLMVRFCSDATREWVTYLHNATFTADGLPLRTVYGNGVLTKRAYDERSRQLISQWTARKDRTGKYTDVLEDISHTYDCVGRCVHTLDASEQTKHFDNCQVKPEWEYAYDAIGQLVFARGRGQLPLSTGKNVRLEAPSATTGLNPIQGKMDAHRLYEYRETYKYDLVGNIRSIKHEAPLSKSVTGWTRRYFYEEPSLLVKSDSNRDNGNRAESHSSGNGDGDRNRDSDSGSSSSGECSPGKLPLSNRLSRTKVGSSEQKYAYDEDAGQLGCMTTLPGYSVLEWNAGNMLSVSSTQNFVTGTPEKTYYVYDHSGRRVRKVTESSAAPGSTPRKERDTLYLGGVEIQHRRPAREATSRTSRSLRVRWVAHVSGAELIALVETTSSNDSNDSGDSGDSGDSSDDEDSQESVQRTLVRYQIGHNMELDTSARLITYEEYTPFGTVAYTAVQGIVEAPREYRFARYEYDQETGLYHCGARYYCPWLGRWTSPDPLGDVDGPNLFSYCDNDPVGYDDHSGLCRTLTQSLEPVGREYRLKTVKNGSMARSTARGTNKSPAPRTVLKKVFTNKKETINFVEANHNRNSVTDRVMRVHENPVADLSQEAPFVRHKVKFVIRRGSVASINSVRAASVRRGDIDARVMNRDPNVDNAADIPAPKAGNRKKADAWSNYARIQDTKVTLQTRLVELSLNTAAHMSTSRHEINGRSQTPVDESLHQAVTDTTAAQDRINDRASDTAILDATAKTIASWVFVKSRVGNAQAVHTQEGRKFNLEERIKDLKSIQAHLNRKMAALEIAKKKL